MRKIIYPILPILLIILISACAGYKPIFESVNLNFEISDYSIKGEKILAKRIYSKLYNLSRATKNNDDRRNISILIDVSKTKKATSKDSTGKILEYKVTLNTKIEINDYLTNDQILNQNFISSLNYKSQNEYSDTVKLENQSINSIINNTYEELLIKLSQNILIK